MKEKKPLVSVQVVTYNSSKYVLDTLDSVKAQTYENIELIISDDCSTDNTVELCRGWVEENGKRFVKAKIVTSQQNTGISANLNRAIRVANGVWIKGIAGDDLLLPNCITDNIEFVNKHPDIYIVQSESSFIDEDSQPIVKAAKVKKRFKDERISAYYQHRLSLFTSNINIQTLFIKKDLYTYIGDYDESIPMMEDRPFYLKATEGGFKIHYFPKVTAVYREHSMSIMKKTFESKIINNHLLSLRVVSEKYVYSHLNRVDLLVHNYYAYVMRNFFKSKFNIRNPFNLVLWFFLKFPFSIYIRFKIFSINKSIDRDLRNHN